MTLLKRVLKEINPKYDRIEYGLYTDYNPQCTLKEKLFSYPYFLLNALKSGVRGAIAGGGIGYVLKKLGADVNLGDFAIFLSMLDFGQYGIRSLAIPFIKHSKKTIEEYIKNSGSDS